MTNFFFTYSILYMKSVVESKFLSKKEEVAVLHSYGIMNHFLNHEL